jgi:hypothetical protein
MTIARLALGLCLGLALATAGAAPPPRTRNVVLVTLDGMRWQELFGGADSLLVRDRRFVRDTTALLRRFWAPDPAARRAALFPFLWGTVAAAGQLYGDRARDSRVDVTNPHRVSYPGYSELLVGFHDARVAGNDKVPNPNRTVLQFVHEQPGMRGRVAAFGSWDVFPYILDEARSGVPVNAGFETAGPGASPRARVLDALQAQIPARWEAVRFDAFTHQYALDHLARRRPRLLYVAYGETDDFAHDGRYDEYLRAAHRTDGFLRELWTWIQSQDDYRDRTTLVVATDHGRGAGADWTKHGADVPGAEATWFAVLGPDAPPLGEAGVRGRFTQGQVAATVAALLGYEYRAARPVEPPLGRATARGSGR